MENIPVKCTGQHEVIVCRELAQTGLEVALVDKTSGLVDDDEGVDGPVVCESPRQSHCQVMSNKAATCIAEKKCHRIHKGTSVHG